MTHATTRRSSRQVSSRLPPLTPHRMHIHEKFKRLSVFEANGERHIQGFTGQDVNGIAFCASRIKELPFLQQFVLAHQKIALAQARNSDSEVRECLLAPIDQLRTDEKFACISGGASSCVWRKC